MATPQLSSYASGTSELPLLGDTIGANLERTVARFADRDALIDCPSGRRWTYAELDRDVDRVARGLLALGVDQGDRVGIWAPNCAEWVLVQYATAKIGALLVNINPAYRTHELSYVLTQAGVTVLVTAESFKTSDYVAMVEEVRGDCPALAHVVVIGTTSWDELVSGGEAVDEAALRERSATLPGLTDSPASSSPSQSGPSRNTTRSSTWTAGRTSSTIAT